VEPPNNELTERGFRQCRQRIGAAFREPIRGLGRYRGNVIGLHFILFRVVRIGASQGIEVY